MRHYGLPKNNLNIWSLVRLFRSSLWIIYMEVKNKKFFLKYKEKKKLTKVNVNRRQMNFKFPFLNLQKMQLWGKNSI